jgi:hypothetical protein
MIGKGWHLSNRFLELVFDLLSNGRISIDCQQNLLLEATTSTTRAVVTSNEHHQQSQGANVNPHHTDKDTLTTVKLVFKNKGTFQNINGMGALSGDLMFLKGLSETSILGTSKWQSDMMLDCHGIHFSKSSCHTMAFPVDSCILKQALSKVL